MIRMHFGLGDADRVDTSTTLSYDLKEPATVMVIICNQYGETIRVIENKRSTGQQQLVWNAEGLAAGVYYCILRTGRGCRR